MVPTDKQWTAWINSMDQREKNLTSQLVRFIEKQARVLDIAEKQLLKEEQARAELEQELGEFHNSLNRMVDERTQELHKANRSLRAEIMHRVQMERELGASRRFVNRITEATPDLLYLYDVMGDHSIYVNPRVMNLLGYTPEQLAKMGGSFFHFVLHPEDALVFAELKERFRQARHSEILESEYRMKNSAGEWRWFLSRNVIFRETSAGQPHLVLGIAQDITERRRTEEELSQSREQLRVLVARQRTVREEERTRISREIHDELGQSLTALKIDLAWIARRLAEDQEPVLRKTKDMSRLIDMNIQTVKRIAAELRPGLLDDLGLTAALEWQAKEFEQSQGIKCELRIRPVDVVLNREISTAIFRIFQETLTNIVRHAEARRVKVHLVKRPVELTLTVRDDGRGITKKQIASSTSIGLVGMRERATFLGGTIEISGSRGRGTTVKVTIPLNS